jgi:hypothetical protein
MRVALPNSVFFFLKQGAKEKKVHICTENLGGKSRDARLNFNLEHDSDVSLSTTLTKNKY